MQPIGDPPTSLEPHQARYWRELAADMPWLCRAHRTILELTCRLAGRMDEERGLGVSGMHALSSLLSKFGATPVDRSRLTYREPEGEDATDRFFRRVN